MTQHDVVIAGGGPTGMVLAAELVLAGVDVLVVEPRPDHELESSRGRGLHARTLEVFDQRGIVDRFLDEGVAAQVQTFGGALLDISDFPTRHNHGLSLVQRDVERLLGAWVAELGVRFARERAVTGFTQDDDGVDVELSDGTGLRAGWLVGCDGGRSTVRKAAGIEFAGWDPTTSWIITEADLAEDPVIGVRPEGGGIGPVDLSTPGGPYGIVLVETTVDHDGDPTVDDLRAALVAAYGTDFGLQEPDWISRFTDVTRQAVSYRQGRVLLAGDAAHVHPPQGGQGLNTGVQDAVNLGWKLAQVVHGAAADDLLDTYHAERHPVGARVLRTSLAQIGLTGPDERVVAVRDKLGELLALDEPRRRLAGEMSGLDIHYDLGDGHPLLGRRMPDLDLQADSGPLRVYELLHDARPLLLDLGGSGGGALDVDLSSWPRVRRVDATYDGTWELPVLGEVDAPGAVLVRPDGHVAWVGTGDAAGLTDALTAWFGAAAA